MKTYLVGGAVRDQLMGKPISDMDYVIVGATHDDMIAAGYERVGADFPVYLHPTSKNEYALARTERKSGKGYLAFEVDFNPSITLKDDLARRDLTINSIALSETADIIDPFHGVEDLQCKVLRHTSPAFAEDPLRVIRLARFYARFDDFTIADETLELAEKLVDSGELEHLSRERFWAEMEKCFTQTNHIDRFFNALDRFGVLNKVSFFKDVFGTPWYAQERMPRIRSAAANFPSLLKEWQLPAFVALIANADAKQESQVIPGIVKRLTENVRIVQSWKYSSRPLSLNVFDLFKNNRAWSDAGHLDILFDTMRVGEACDIHFPIRTDLLHKAFTYSRSVNAKEYMHLKGKEIGNAMDDERRLQIRLVLGIPNI